MSKRIESWIVIFAVSLLSISASADCSFVSSKGVDNFTYKVSKEDCELIDFNGESVATIHVEYPVMKLVSYKSKSENVVTLRISPINVPPFDIDRSYSGVKVLSSVEGLDLLKESETTYRRVGSDGTNAYIIKWQAIFVGKRVYKEKLMVQYTFDHKLSDIKSVDEFVLGFLNKFIVNLSCSPRPL